VVYIAFEGGEGSGKSTQARLLAERLDAVVTREPGGTDLGGRLRSLLLDPGEAPVGPRAETLLMAADRAQHMRQVVRPALEAGRHVVSDRSVFSSLAYQGGGRQLGVDAVRQLNDWALDGCWPDRVILLDLTPEAANVRLTRGLDRLEQEAASFHDRVRATYLDLAASDDRWVVIDASASIDDVAASVWAAVACETSS
jgi:dTMP kinase